jgi:uncharacterized protein (DUF2252 family)
MLGGMARARVGIVDAKKLAARQIADDRDKTIGGALGKRLGRQLFERKVARMRASPFAFLRGAAPLFYELLSERPDLADGPRGRGWIAGDLHLENFGAYHPEHLHPEAKPTTATKAGAARSAAKKVAGTKSARTKLGKAKDGHESEAVKESREEHRVAFGLNDFDDATIAPWRFDVLRLMTSVILAGRELGCDGARAVYLCRALLDAYCARAFDGAPIPPAPGPVKRLIGQVAERTRDELLDGRTEVHGKSRRFVRGERYADLPHDLSAELEKALAKYAKSIPKEERPKPEELHVVDAAVRIAGTGSLGSLRIAALVRGKGGIDGGWIIDLKEQGQPSASVVVGKSSLSPEARVLEAFAKSSVRPPRLLGTSSIKGVPLFVRRLMPQEDKLDLTHLDDGDLEPLARFLGALVATSHLHGAKAEKGTGSAKVKKWKKSEREALIDHTIVLAGIHEAVYLAYCKMIADGV